MLRRIRQSQALAGLQQRSLVRAGVGEHCTGSGQIKIARHIACSIAHQITP